MSQPLFCLGMAPETALFERIEGQLTSFGDVTVKHDRTQTAFVRRVQFAWVSLPRRKTDAGTVMLSIGLPFCVESPRLLHAAEVSPGRWMHHMLLREEDELDGEVIGWLEAAWALVGPGRKALTASCKRDERLLHPENGQAD